MITRVSLPDTEVKLLTGSIPGAKLRDDSWIDGNWLIGFVRRPGQFRMQRR